MSVPRVVILRAPGINCDGETQHAWRLAGAECDVLHLHRLVETPGALDRYDVLTVPGGFSYGDDVSAGRILANRIAHRLGDALHAFLRRGRLMIGICNGYQVLVKAGILDGGGTRCTLTLNNTGRFDCRWTSLYCATDRCVFLEAQRTYFLPIAHAEGRFAVADPRAFDRDRVALRYCDGVARIGPANPSGSFDDVAALTDATGRVLGLMPHPERHVDAVQHPFWTTAAGGAEPDGLSIFRAAVAAMR